MRMLVIGDEPPWPTNSGGRLVVSREVTALRTAGHAVDFIYYKHRGEADGVAEALGPESTLASVERLSLLQALASRPRAPYQMASREVVETQVTASGDGAYDLIICHHEWVLPLGAAIRAENSRRGHAGRLVLRSHNDEVQYYRALLEGRLELSKRAYLTLERLRISRRLVQRVAGLADEIWLISPQDESAYAGLEIPRKLVPPILVEGEQELPPPVTDDRPDNLLFVGALDPPHAVRGLEWFLDGVWPTVRSQLPASRFIVAGRRASNRLRQKLASSPGVTFLGEIESLDDVWGMGGVFVNPVFAGSGINLKVGNPAERGIPVVTTSTGARGFVPGPGIVVADTAAAYAAACVSLLSDHSAWARASVDARARIAAYSPAAFLQAAGLAGR